MPQRASDDERFRIESHARPDALQSRDRVHVQSVAAFGRMGDVPVRYL